MYVFIIIYITIAPAVAERNRNCRKKVGQNYAIAAFMRVFVDFSQSGTSGGARTDAFFRHLSAKYKSRTRFTQI